MAVLFIDGFDFGDQPHITGVVTPFGPSCKYIAYNRIGASIQAGLRVAGTAAGIQNSLRFENVGFGNQTYTKILGSRSGFCIGFAVNFIDITLPATPVVRFEAGGTTVSGPSGGDNSTTALFLEVLHADNTISIYTGPQGTNATPGTLLWNSSGVYAIPLRTSVWLELQVDTSTGTWAVYANDVLLQQQTGVSIPSGIDRFSLLSQGFEQHYIDDLYVTDGDQLGPCRVTGFPPISQSTHEWTPLTDTNVSQVREFGNRAFPLQTPDDNTSYVAAAAAGLTDRYGFASPICYGRILALALNADGSAVTGSPSINFLVKISGTEYPAGSSDSYIGGFTIRQAISQLNPATGTYWTDAEIASALFGFSMAGSGQLRITQWMLEKLVSLRSVPFNCGQASYSFSG